MGPHGHARIVVIAAVVTVVTTSACACRVSAAPQAPLPDVDAVMERVADRVSDYWRQAQRVIVVERSTVQPIQPNWSSDGFARTVESELRVETGGFLPEATLIRDIRRINGRAPRERDKTDRAGCTDPNPLSPEPLAFLLPAQRENYRFTSVRTGREDDRAAFVVDFVSTNRRSRPVLVEDERGHHDCFDWTGPVASRGRIWVDANTHDVLRVDRRIDAPLDVQVPWTLQRSYGLPPWVVIDRDDTSLRYKAVAFSNPDEVLMLPESIESLTVVRSALQSTRRTQEFSGYRRFLTNGRVVKDP